MRLVPPGNSSKEIVKVKVERCVGTRSFRWLPKMEPDIVEIAVT